MIVSDIVKALPAGEIVDDPAKLKAYGQLGNYGSIALSLMVSAIKLKYPDFIFPEEFNAPAAVLIAALLGYINTVIAKATTRKDIRVSQLVK